MHKLKKLYEGIFPILHHTSKFQNKRPKKKKKSYVSHHLELENFGEKLAN